jgi:hypothetical protein
MSMPDYLNGEEYYSRLRANRDLALKKSKSFGNRKNLGKLSWGMAHASWRTEDDGAARLSDEGMRYGHTTLTKIKPTTLMLYEPGEGAFELVEYKMDLDDIYTIDVYRTIIVHGTFKAIAQFEAAKFKERRLGLQHPSRSDRVKIFEEMERGATGLYLP